ncbi:MAG TPA: hypothetical protein VMV06_04470 [Acidimicrobiales bacterium]|nr:hypothetical protein [Acidimicrobiales bacterium]
MTNSVHRPDSRRPAVAVLTAHWETTSEAGWITRQVAGALACSADVHVIIPDGAGPAVAMDGVFSVHWLGTPICPAAELRRELLVEGISETGTGGGLAMTPELGALLDEDLIEPWAGAADVLTALLPDLVVIADHRNIGALRAADHHSPEVPVVLLALGSDARSLAFPHFDPLFDRADTVLAATETERSLIVQHHGSPGKVRRIGAALAANPSVLTEPNPWVGATEYVLVLTGVDEEGEHEENELSRLLRVRFPDNPVGIAHNDAFCAWHEGRVTRGWPIERSSDLDRLMAWARVTVDLRPGRLLARRCVTSLLFGTPIVVPEHSRAQEHAKRGGGGLWFSNPADLAWCVEALLEPSTRQLFSTQGRTYAEEEYGSTDAFIDRVGKACDLVPTAEPARNST